ncbi:tetratricopeptide repeat protein [Methylomagnum sp.]
MLGRICRWGLVLGLLSGAALADMNKGLDAVERRDWPKAFAEFRPLAEKGDADAQVNLGNLYMKGYGVEQDYIAARRWYLKAAAQNNATAQGKLGLMDYYGLGVEENHAEAAHWFHEAAEQGEPGAASILGSLYAAGDGVEKDQAQAYVWYTVAIERGSRDAESNRAALVDEMSPGEMDTALTRLAAWRKQHEPEMEEAPPQAGTGGAPGKAKGGKPKQSAKPDANAAPSSSGPKHKPHPPHPPGRHSESK